MIRRVIRNASASVGMAGALLLGLGAGSAFGYFTASGAGNGSASTATMMPVTGTLGTPTTRLVPGGTADVAVMVTNPNPFPVTVVSAVGDSILTVDAAHQSCPADSVTFTTPSVVNEPIPANTTQVLSIPGAASMDESTPNECQGATFSIPLTLTVRSS